MLKPTSCWLGKKPYREHRHWHLRVWMLSYKSLVCPFFLSPWGKVMHTSSRTEKYVGQCIASTYRSCNQQYRKGPQSLRMSSSKLGFSGFCLFFFWSVFFLFFWVMRHLSSRWFKRRNKKKRKDHRWNDKIYCFFWCLFSLSLND